MPQRCLPPIDKVVSHALATKVKVAIAEAERLIHVRLFVYVEGRGFRLVQNDELLGVDFDFSGRQVRVLCTLGSEAHLSRYLNYPLVP